MYRSLPVKIPSDNTKRDKMRRLDYFANLKEKCLVSRTERIERYTGLRLYWLYGTDGGMVNDDDDTNNGPPPNNKIWPHIDLLTSFMYAQDTTRFSVELGAGVNKDFQNWVPKLSQYVNDEWHSSNTDIIVSLALAYSLVYGWTGIKPIWKMNGIQPGIIMPHNFGVLREDNFMLTKQEAYIHCYTMTTSQFENDYNFLPNFKDLAKRVQSRTQEMVEQTTGVDRIIMSGQDPLSGNGVGVVDWLTQVAMSYVPKVQENLIEMYELTVWDDELNDYRLITMADPGVPILDRPMKDVGGLKNEVSCVGLCPNPDPGYFWGISEVERLMPLQTYRNKIMAQIDHLQEMEAHPPSTAVGFPGDLLELQYAMDTPGGFFNQPDAPSGGSSAKAERVQITTPQDLYVRLDRNDQMFEDMSGLQGVAQGKSETGVRSGGHAAQLAKLGASRARKRSLIVEDNLADIATLYLKLQKKYDKEILSSDDGTKFVADQFTDDFVVKVDAHSNSPIFVDDLQQLATLLLKLKVITRKRYLQLISIPMRSQLIADLEDIIEPGEAKEAAQKEKLEMARITAKGGGRPRANGQGMPSNGK